MMDCQELALGGVVAHSLAHLVLKVARQRVVARIGEPHFIALVLEKRRFKIDG